MEPATKSYPVGESHGPTEPVCAYSQLPPDWPTNPICP